MSLARQNLTVDPFERDPRWSAINERYAAADAVASRRLKRRLTVSMFGLGGALTSLALNLHGYLDLREKRAALELRLHEPSEYVEWKGEPQVLPPADLAKVECSQLHGFLGGRRCEFGL